MRLYGVKKGGEGDEGRDRRAFGRRGKGTTPRGLPAHAMLGGPLETPKSRLGARHVPVQAF